MKELEFSQVYTLLNAIKEGDESKKDLLTSISSDFKTGSNAESFLQELGQSYLSVGIEELFNYTKLVNLQLIGKLTKEDWENLSITNKSDLPIYLATKMTNYFKENKLSEKLSKKWNISQREIQKHVTPMARYITEGFIDLLE